MIYYVIELQEPWDGSPANLVYVKEDLNEALSTFHSILAAAALSSLKTHAATILNTNGEQIERGSFNHPNPEE